jgi:dienelactone hydrolase
VLFEMLTGQPPVDSNSLQQIVTQKLTGGYPRLRELRSALPEPLEAAIDRALSPDRTLRFASVEEFSNAITASLPQAPAVSTRTRWMLAAAVGVGLVASAVLVYHQQRLVRATQQVAEIERLVRDQRFHDAFQAAEKVLPILPNDTTLNRLRPVFTDFLNIVTVPPGATVSIRRLGDSDSTWRTVGTTPITRLPMPKLLAEMGYQMRIRHAGFETAEVLASVFTDLSLLGGSRPIDTMYLDPVGRPTANMMRIRGFTIPNGKDTIHVGDYYIGKREVTNAEYKRFVDAGGYGRPEYWTEPMVRDGKPVRWEDGVATLVDQTGRPGPSTWTGGTFPTGRENYPVGGVSWYEAAAYARFAKMRLPTERHWSIAAMRNAREVLWMYAPWSNMNSTSVRPVAQGRMSAWGLYDVAGNVREWCVNALGSGRLTYGGAWEDSPFNINHRIERDAFDRSADNGLRLAQYSDADSVVAFLTRPLIRLPRADFNKVVAVSDATFEGFRRMYDYDPQPLDTKLENEGQTSTMRWQKVSFTASYPGPRMAAYLLFPRNASGPFEPVILWAASGAITDRHFNPADPMLGTFIGSIPQSGRVLVVPLFMGTYERDDSTFSITQSIPDSTTRFRDLRVQWIKDLRRTVDFLETRKDIRADRLGFYGLSWGGENAPVALAMDPRIKAAVLYSAGYHARAARAEVNAVNYAPRVHTPTLMLNGKYDVVFPYETSQKPFFDQLGTPARDKKMVMSETGHIVPLDIGIKAGLEWFDKYLTHGGGTEDSRISAPRK